MAQKTPPAQPGKTGESREDRLKAALKANLGRRKAQARARSAGEASAEAEKSGGNKG
ncbi:MAG: hypothetical protein WAO69_14865 [Aestuariivita sp.]|uniref:hypothetical protein n=1 Tax=Aestuariivita sp. TaxID=1872407 RepID=UPI003BB1FF81